MYEYIDINMHIVFKPDEIVDAIGVSNYFKSPYVIDWVEWWHVNDETGDIDKNKDRYMRYMGYKLNKR